MFAETEAEYDKKCDLNREDHKVKDAVGQPRGRAYASARV